MKKLITSAEVTFRTGDDTYTRQHLVAAYVAHDATENDVLERTTNIVKSRFKDLYPESELISITPIPTMTMTPITTTVDKTQKVPVLNVAFTADQLPPRNESGESDQVLIDLEGDRTEFIIGCYDFISKEWVQDNGNGIIIDDHMRWMYLPLAKYDK